MIQALSGFKAVNLVTDSILILGCHYSSKKELVIEKNFNAIIENMPTVLGLWSSRGLTVGGTCKILVFEKPFFLQNAIHCSNECCTKTNHLTT